MSLVSGLFEGGGMRDAGCTGCMEGTSRGGGAVLISGQGEWSTKNCVRLSNELIQPVPKVEFAHMY